MTQATQPKVKLKGIEYLLLSIQSHPGKSQRWHLRRRYTYQNGRSDRHKGGSGCGYFVSPSYRNVLWTDRSDQDVIYVATCPVDGWVFGNRACRSKCAQMHLTARGWERANEVRKKLGLDPIPYSAPELITGTKEALRRLTIRAT